MSVMAVFPTKGRIGKEKFPSLIIEVYRGGGEKKEMNVSYTAPADNRALLLLIILSGRQVLKNYYDYHWVSESVMSLLQSWNILINALL